MISWSKIKEWLFGEPMYSDERITSEIIRSNAVALANKSLRIRIAELETELSDTKDRLSTLQDGPQDPPDELGQRIPCPPGMDGPRTSFSSRADAWVIAAAALTPAFAQPSVGVSIGVNQPGVYGRINIGNFPPPPLVYAQPVIITRPAHYVRQQPLYLYVPPGHQQNWRKHCARYNACGQPVYFVKEQWVRERYEERHRHDDHRGPRHHNDHGR